MRVSDPIGSLHGVGKVTEAKLNKLGINTLGELLYYFPRAYEKRGNIKLLSEYSTEFASAYMLTVSTEVRSVKVKGNITISKFRAFDDSGAVEVVFFNSPFIKDTFHVGSTFRFYGKLQESKGRLQLLNPKYEAYIEGIPLPDFVPIYPLTSGISSKTLDKLIRTVLNEVASELNDPIPDELRIANSLPTLTYAIKNIHFPESDSDLKRALERMAYEEMLCFGIGISMSAKNRERGVGVRFSPCSLGPITEKLPYELTDSQKNAVNDIYKDTVIGKDGRISPMARIIVGDVGCGKTVCAAMAIYIAAMSGFQSALMVPTEILARQHYADLSELLGSVGIKTELLLGSTSASEKRRIRAAAADGEALVFIGTHALLSDKLEFNRLGLIITDEQHRFGVRQRAVLKERSQTAHLLVMSATPIPRTLALTLYGDLDISRITEMPRGRQRVDTYVVGEEYRLRLNEFIRKQIKLGGQCYVVCPSIESDSESEEEFIPERIGSMVSSKSLNLKSAIDYTEALRRALPELRIDVLHGRMKAAEKDSVMSLFADGGIDVLVSTTVIEVGVNVPNASLMIVENAVRFGLSQLHQLRGRVGRGKRKSYCVLVSDTNAEKSRARLEVMRTTYDGYKIAESDLLLRGPGDFFSSNSGENLRQSGGFEFKFASMAESSELYLKAFEAAKSIVEKDPSLSLEKHKKLKEAVEDRLSYSLSTIS